MGHRDLECSQEHGGCNTEDWKDGGSEAAVTSKHMYMCVCMTENRFPEETKSELCSLGIGNKILPTL